MLKTSFRGGVAGAVATVVMTLEHPLDKRLFDSNYDDIETLGKLVTRADGWYPIGFALHVQTARSWAPHTRGSSHPCRGRPSSAASWRDSSSTSRPGR
jgi:hypothetical protein